MIQLVPFCTEFLTPRYVAWLNDPQVVRFSEQRHRTHTLESCRAYAGSVEAPDKFWAITLDGRHIGNITATIDSRNSVADIAIMIGERDVWGQGHGLAAWNEAITLCGARKITAGTMEVNLPMQRLFTKSGMTVIGIKARQFLWEGQEVGMVMAEKFPERR